MAIIKNLLIDQYTDFSKTFIFYDINHAPVNLTNYTANAAIKKSSTSNNITANFTTEILNPATDGKVLLTLNYNDLINIKPGKYEYDILLISNTNIHIRAVQGIAEISGNISE